MHGSLALPISQRLKLVRQSIYASLKFQGHVFLSVSPDPLGAAIHVEGKTIYVPSALRWKLYRKGWRARLDQLEREYGVGRHCRLKEGSVILDIGANAGEFAHIAARHGARIYCAEPDPAVFSCLEANTAALANASIHDALFWHANEDISFYSAPARADSSVFDEGQGPQLTKRATTVEQFCADQDISQIDLLKCDAEGAEPEVLQGIGAMFPKIRIIALDTGAERKGERTNHACREILEAHGFYVIDEIVGKRLMTYGLANPAL